MQINGEDVRIIVRIRIRFVIGDESNLVSIRTEGDRMIIVVAGSKLPRLWFIDGGNPNVRAAPVGKGCARLVLDAIDDARVVVMRSFSCPVDVVDRRSDIFAGGDVGDAFRVGGSRQRLAGVGYEKVCILN